MPYPGDVLHEYGKLFLEDINNDGQDEIFYLTKERGSSTYWIMKLAMILDMESVDMQQMILLPFQIEGTLVPLSSVFFIVNGNGFHAETDNNWSLIS